ncbi:MAG: hypothetical protein HKN92_09885 [Chitinophagales bacterium]|nr:hypothetical protein [Chitinophagales bacterium]
MKLYLLLIIGIISSPFFGFSQAGFQYAYGQFGIDQAYSMIRTSDNALVLTGEYDVNGAQVYLIKLDSSGSMIWSQTYGRAKEMKTANGSGNRGYSVIQTHDGGFMIGGEAHSFGEGQADMYIIKTDSAANHIWSRTLGGNLDEYCYSIIETSDSCFLLAGSTESVGSGFRNVYLAKISAVGDSIWTKTIGDTFFEAANEIIEIEDGFVLAGYTYSTPSGNADFLLLKLDFNGNILWQRSYGWEFHDFAESVIQTHDGGFIVVGSREVDISGETDVLLIKADSAGNIQWSRSYGGSDVEDGNSVIQLEDNGFAIVGFSKSFGAGQEDVLVIRTDSIGNLILSNVYGGSSQDIGLDLVQGSAGELYISGRVQSFNIATSDVYLLKLDANGESGCHQSVASISVSTDTANAYNLNLMVGDGGVLDTSNTIFGSTSTVRIDVCDTPSNIISLEELDVEIYPTLTNGSINIRFPDLGFYSGVVKDNLGRAVFRFFHSLGFSKILDVSHFDSGLYYIEIESRKGRKLERVLLLK